MNTGRLQPAEELVPRRKVETWHAIADEAYEAGGASGIIKSLFDGLIAYLQGVLHSIIPGEVEHTDYGLLERSAASLLFWGLDHGISQGDLDKLLQHSSLLRDTVLLVLISIGELLGRGFTQSFLSTKTHTKLLVSSNISTLIEKAKFVVGETDELDPSHGPTVEPVEVCQILQSKIDCLITLNDSIECPAESESDDEEEARHGAIIQDLPAHQFFADLIAARFPSAQLQLVERLGLTNWSRYNHVQQQRNSLQTEDGSKQRDKSRSEFHDSGIGSDPSLALLDLSRPQSVYAATVVSSRAEASHKRLPSLPRDARDGKPFTCEVCNRLISVRRLKDWREHVFKDICAYTCVFPECDSLGILFEDVETMKSHVSAQHCKSPGVLDIPCPLCTSHMAGSISVAILHLARHMEEIALIVLPHGEEELEEESGSSKSSDLPLSEQNYQEMFGCQQCANSFETLVELDAHVSATRHGSENDLDNQVHSGSDIRAPMRAEAKTTSFDPRKTLRQAQLESEAQKRSSIEANRQQLLAQQHDPMQTFDAPSPTPSEISVTPSDVSDILVCQIDGCEIQFTGRHRRGNFCRHKRLIHNSARFLCSINGCERIFKRPDALLKHRRKHHRYDLPLLKPPEPRKHRKSF